MGAEFSFQGLRAFQSGSANGLRAQGRGDFRRESRPPWVIPRTGLSIEAHSVVLKTQYSADPWGH